MPDTRDDRSQDSDMACDPFAYAMEERRRDAVAMVEAALDSDRVVLAFQPVVMARNNET